jgi:carboxypeptidase Q
MNKKITALLGSAALALPASALFAAPDAVQTAMEKDTIALSITEGLTTWVGPRQAGTEAEARARTWAVTELKRLGFAKVRIETFDMPTWVRGQESAQITSPVPAKLAITALGNSGATPTEGIEAEVMYFASLAELEAASDTAVKGKIAFVSHAMKATQDGSSYGYFGQVRRVGPDVASKKGAAAIVIRSIGTDYHRNPHTGNTNFSQGVAAIPAAAISIPDAENLERLLASGKPMRMKLLLTPKNIGMQQSGNVIAEVLGKDASLPPIVIACHLDSWDLATGAIDDAAGCGIITAAAKIVMDAGKPQRTIRVLWAGAEEVGIWGGKDYAVKNAAIKHGLAMESDFGADRVWQVKFNLPESAKPLRDNLVRELAKIGIGASADKAGGGADVGPIIAAQNLGVIDLDQDGTRYFELHHTPDDTFDKIDPVQMRQNVAAWVAVLREVANYTDDLNMPVKP